VKIVYRVGGVDMIQYDTIGYLLSLGAEERTGEERIDTIPEKRGAEASSNLFSILPPKETQNTEHKKKKVGESRISGA
jgi:hypothetical protein